MKYHICKIVVLLFASVSYQIYGQVPGYMGKRLAIGYRFEASPIGLNFFVREEYRNLKYNGEQTQWYNISMAHNVDVEFALFKQLTLRCIYGTASNGGFSYPSYYSYSSSYSGSSSSRNGEPDFFANDYPTLSAARDYKVSPYGYKENDATLKSYDYINYTTRMLKMGLCFAQGFYYSPHGRHFGLYLINNKSTVNYVFNNKETAFAEVNSYGLQVETTKRRVIKDMFILEYGYSIAYMFGSKVWSDKPVDNLGVYIASKENGRIMFQLVLGARYLIPNFFDKNKKAKNTSN
jgi:hypothetical protein